jgi:hypothetical protein
MTNPRKASMDVMRVVGRTPASLAGARLGTVDVATVVMTDAFYCPFLLGDTLIACCDLKADRARNVLMVQSAFLEPKQRIRFIVGDLVDEFRQMQTWLRLGRIEVADRGDLAPALPGASLPAADTRRCLPCELTYPERATAGCWPKYLRTQGGHRRRRGHIVALAVWCGVI